MHFCEPFTLCKEKSAESGLKECELHGPIISIVQQNTYVQHRDDASIHRDKLNIYFFLLVFHGIRCHVVQIAKCHKRQIVYPLPSKQCNPLPQKEPNFSIFMQYLGKYWFAPSAHRLHWICHWIN